MFQITDFDLSALGCAVGRRAPLVTKTSRFWIVFGNAENGKAMRLKGLGFVQPDLTHSI
jgi:hypothetical protein